MRLPAYLLALTFLFVGAGPATAQWLDARMPRRGSLEMEISGQNLSVAGRFRSGSEEKLRDVWALALDARLVPALDTLDAQLPGVFSSLNLGTPPASHLGVLRYDVLFERTQVPIKLTFGATSWFAAFAVVPIVKGESFIGTVLDSLVANAGPGSFAFAGNPDAFFAGVSSGIAALESIIAADTLAPDVQQQAMALLTDARNMEAGLTGLRDLEYLPTDSATAGRQLTGLYQELQLGFEDLAIDLPDLSLSQPIPADSAVILTSLLGYENPAARATGVKFGDIEVGISLQPLNTFRQRDGRSGPVIPVRARLDALWRFATGDPPEPDGIADAGTADGQADLELRSTLDLGFGRRLWLSLFGAYNMQMEGALRRRIYPGESPLRPGGYPASVLWDPGDVLTLAIVPRLNITRHLTLSGMYTVIQHERDAVTLVGAAPPDAAFPATLVEEGTEYTARTLGFALRYSAADWARVAADGMPVEVELRHRKTLSASDGIVPLENVWEVSLRVYRAIFR